MLKCPKCGKEIERLNYSYEEYGNAYLDDKGNIERNIKGGSGETFSCPECYADLFDDELEAIKFLTSK